MPGLGSQEWGWGWAEDRGVQGGSGGSHSRRAQGSGKSFRAETLGDDGGSLGSPPDWRPRGVHCFLPPMVYQKRPPHPSPSEQSRQSSRF